MQHLCLKTFEKRLTIFLGEHFGPRVYPMGSMVIALVSPLVRWSVFKYLEDRSLVFSETFHEVRGH